MKDLRGNQPYSVTTTANCCHACAPTAGLCPVGSYMKANKIQVWNNPPSGTAGANPLQTRPHAFPAAAKLSAHLQRGETPITLIRTHERTLRGGFGLFFFPSNSLQDTDINVEISLGLFGFFFFLFFLIQEDASARQCGLPRSARSSAAPERGCARPR